MSSAAAVRNLVRELLLNEGYASRVPLHLRLESRRSGSRRSGVREAAGHLKLQSGNYDAKAARTQARQHTALAGGHAQAARDSRSPDTIAAHKDAETLHQQAAGHYHSASGAFRRGANREVGGHMDRAKTSGRLAHTATRNVAGGRL
jgi:hypothetical protein